MYCYCYYSSSIRAKDAMAAAVVVAAVVVAPFDSDVASSISRRPSSP